ncbi:GntR family transcriptional regulator [Rothia sp. ZJ932]|uniref:GntR family transcriptional regulator n=1 Tax=Rothia sp. ZJ932 TaxID=2810516 RepID=UPI001967A1AA|nr:GntR family transcriptional regulator [Rothia sp. ZJ932]QRZ61474.1 GntR family transcriptional regulator [Rothia sp. ZJ932]
MTEPVSSINIDKNSPIPLYHQLVEGIRSAISNGALTSGSMLPNELDIAKNLHLSRPTVRKAMDELVRAGLLVRKRGVGTQVVSNEIRRSLTLSSLYDDLVRSGIKVSTKILTFETIIPPAEIGQELTLESKSTVYHIRRLRYENGTPLAVMENWVPTNIGDLKPSFLEQKGLYETMRSLGVTFSVGHQKVGAKNATVDEAGFLGVSTDAALVTMHRTTLNDVGTRVETGSHVYRADLYTFEMTLSQ